MDFPHRPAARRKRAAERNLLRSLLVFSLLPVAVAAPAGAQVPVPCPSSFPDVRLIGDFSVAAQPETLRLGILNPCEWVAIVRLRAGETQFRIQPFGQFGFPPGFVPDAYGGDGTSVLNAPGGPYPTVRPGGPGNAIRMQVAVADTGWFVLRFAETSGTWTAEKKPPFPQLHLRAFAGVPSSTGADSTVTRKTTVRWLRDPEGERTPNFGGYRIYRQTTDRDTTNMELMRRFTRTLVGGVNRPDTLLWHFPSDQPVLQFVDPDSAGNLIKVCREVDELGRCVQPGDSVFSLQSPPGPHNGFPLYYTVVYGAFDQTLRETAEMFVPDTTGVIGPCPAPGPPATCPNLNNKATNLPANPVYVSSPAQPNLEGVIVVPNPYRGSERWDVSGQGRVQFQNITGRATIKIYTASGDFVRQLEHDDPLSAGADWDLKNANGQDVASGIYLFHLKSEQGYEKKGHFVIIR